MQLNLGTKKNFSEANMRRIINLIIGISSQTSQLQDQCLTDYDETRVYSAGNITIYDGYIWEAKTVATGTWDVSKWTKIGTDDITELSKSDIEALINLTPEEISKLSDIISTEIRLDKTFSSSDTYMRIQAAIDTAKEYTNNQLGKAVKPAYKVVSSTSEVTETGYFYLISNGTNYDMFVLSADGSVVSLGTSDVDLTNYYTKTELDSDFLKKTDAASTYAEITTVDGKVDKDKILTATSATATNEQVYSASVVNTELDKKFEKDNILSIIQDTDNTKVFGAKAVYDTFNQKTDKVNCYEIKDSTGKSKHIVIDLPASHSISGKTTRLFVSDDITAIGLQVWNGSTLEKDLRVSMVNPNHLYIPTKALTPVSTNINFTNGDSSCYYTVINGICYVNIWSMNITANLSVETLFNNLPTAKAPAQFLLSNSVGSKTVGMGWISGGSSVIACNAKLEDGTAKSQGYARFSYPVAESWNPS